MFYYFILNIVPVLTIDKDIVYPKIMKTLQCYIEMETFTSKFNPYLIHCIITDVFIDQVRLS